MAAGKRTTTSLRRNRPALPAAASIPRRASTALPIISGHVGADAAACMLAVDLAHEDRIVAIMDIGTNTELIVGNRHRILAASCPAGPAFEGGAIACGMPALDGAIEDVRIGDDGRFPPASGRRRGAAGHLRFRPGGADERIAAHRADERARPLRRRRPSHRARRANTASTSWRATSTNWRRPKAPTSPACKWCSASSASISTNRRFYLAGGFGRHLNVDAATRIGLIPDLPARQMVQIGNAAIEGATIALLSRAKAPGVGRAGQAGGALPAGNAPAILRFLRGWLPVPAD